MTAKVLREVKGTGARGQGGRDYMRNGFKPVSNKQALSDRLYRPIEHAGHAWVQKDDGSFGPILVGARDDIDIVWSPQEGSQYAFIHCPVFETCYEGTRGPGKTDALIVDFLSGVGPDERTLAEKRAGVKQERGWGSEWRGILFRRTYPELQDVIDKSKKLIPQIYPLAVYNESRSVWVFPDGEKLFFRPFTRPADYWSYHGHAYPWIGWEELTTWPDDKCFKSMFSCVRSTAPGMPSRVRATTNPFGVGHNWVKHRYQLPVQPGKICGPIITESVDGETGIKEPPRVAITGRLRENQVLMRSDPEYVPRLVASAPNSAALQAWLLGGWDIVSGGMLDDVWIRAQSHAVLPKFNVPHTWTIDRSFDWGDSKPFSVLWWAESDGSDLHLPGGNVMSTVPGDTFLIHEWYGWNGRPNEGCKMLAKDIASGIVEAELGLGIHDRVIAGPADSSIFDDENGNCIARDMAKAVRVRDRLHKGVRWIKADKSPGSRVQGWQQIRKRLAATVPTKRGPREEPGLFIVKHCRHWLRTVPTLPRDEKKPDDVDSASEDHAGDATRYRLVRRRAKARAGQTTGYF